MAVVSDGVEPFGLGTVCEAFDEPYHPEDDNPVFDFSLATAEPGRVRGTSYDVHVEHGLDVVAEADLVALVPAEDFRHADERVSEAVVEAHARGATVMTFCTGTFLLAATGLLDGRRATTHWRHADELARRHPEIEVQPDVLYVQEDRLLTGAGTAAGLDVSLHLIRQEFGATVASSAARRMVMPPHRDGGQAQFIRQQVPDCSAQTLGPLLRWVLEHLGEDLSVGALAREAGLSERTLARRFVEETGSTPHRWITDQRVRLAEEFLERNDLPVETIAHRVGFGSAATMRQQFTRVRGLAPAEYRRRFAAS